MSSNLIEAKITEIRQKAERYQTTVHALLAFSAYVVHDGSEVRDGAHFGFGRRMDTSEENHVSPSSEVTPDLVAQKSSAYGMAGEVKAGLSGSDATWQENIRQLQKYDDELAGWWTDTEKVETSDAVLLIDQSKARPFIRYLIEQLKGGEGLPEERTAVVEFNRSDNVDPFIFFRREWGTVRDGDLAPRLEEGVQVPILKVLGTFPSIQFYDSPPPVQWLMEILWMDSFAARQDPSAYDEAAGAWPMRVTVAELTEELQRGYGSRALSPDERSCEFPKMSWVREALDQFVRVKYAIPPNDEGEVYTILFRPLRGDVLGKFVELIERTRPKRQEPEPDQTELDLEAQRNMLQEEDE